MEVFTIFLCIVIGHAFGDLQGIEIDKDDLKAREDAREALSHYVKEAINLDQNLQSKDAQLSAQSGNSDETETDEKPSSPVMGSPVTSGAYEVKKSGQKKVYLETRTADIRSLWKHYVRSISAKKDSMKFRSFPVKSAAIKKRRSFRRKRDLDSFNLFLEPAFEVLHPPERRTGGGAQNAPKKTKKEKEASVGESKQEKAEEEKKEEKKEEEKQEEKTEEKAEEEKQEEKKEEEKQEEKKEEEKEEKKEEKKEEEKQEEKKKEEKEEKKEEKKEEEKKEEKKEEEKEEKKEEKKEEEKKKEEVKEEKKEKKEEKKEEKNEKVKQPPKTSGFNDPDVTCDVKILMSDAEIKEMVDTHNDARRREKASDMRKLVWDPIAAKLAQQKASTCEYGHSMLIDCKDRDLGQNIFASWTSDGKEYVKLNVTGVTYAWADEYKDWDYKAKKCNPGKKCGHWELLTGDKVESVGCGAAKCVKMKHGDKFESRATYVVCDYFPYKPVFTEGQHCSKCEKGFTCEQKLCVAPKNL